MTVVLTCVATENKIKQSEYRFQKYFPQLKHEKSLSNLKFYDRQENNPWRPIIAQEITELKRQLSKQLSMQNMLSGKRKLQKYKLPFHYSKLKREKNKRLRLKKKKLKMLQKLYKIGLALPRPLEIIEHDKDYASEQINDSLYDQQLLQTRLNQRINSKSCLEVTTQEQEIEELLDWSYNLDFNEYLMEWASLGTSANSQLFIPQNNEFGLSEIDKLVNDL